MSAVLKLKLGDGARVLRGHGHLWSVIQRLGRNGASFTLTQVDQAANGHRDTVRDYLKRLVRAGYLEVAGWTGPHRARAPLYRLVKTARQAPRLRRDGTECAPTRQQAMWNILRGPQARAGITAFDLRLAASTERVPITPQSAKTFLRRLHKAGYLIVLREAKSGPDGCPAVYRLPPGNDTGPLAPMILSTKLVYDQNQDRIAGEPELREVTG